VTVRWDDDKPHRCPYCNTAPDVGPPTSLAVYECCRCSTRYARWPRLAWLLPIRRCADIERGECPGGWHVSRDGKDRR
jgi:hypothetical protein